MPVRFLSDAQRDQLSGFPRELDAGLLERFFTLSDADLAEAGRRRGPPSRLGWALQGWITRGSQGSSWLPRIGFSGTRRLGREGWLTTSEAVAEHLPSAQAPHLACKGRVYSVSSAATG